MLPNAAGIARRQLWNLPPGTSTTSPTHCTPFILPLNGVLELADSVITLTQDVLFQPECTGTVSGDVFAPSHLREPFYASIIPMTYVIAAATVIAWILVVMLTITPRTAFLGTPLAAPSFSSGHGIIGGANGGSTSLSGTGTRPWLQKVAALTVAISLTIATADTFEVADQQYNSGYMETTLLREAVLGSLEIRVTRVISDVFLWLAQVQTLVRLFPRHKEKVLIKWIGFALILCDSVFSCLNSFLINSPAKGRRFVDAIPALSYLFELALGLLYAAWVIYYAMTKRRYAFYHPKMRNICLIALLSLVAILTPVVFFITDVSNQDVAGWGDYFRWVGAAAASVIVWEWVERIEALESDEKKDGILGREVFDGDEMLDVSPSDDFVFAQSRTMRARFRRSGRDDDQAGGHPTSALERGFGDMAQRYRSKHLQSPSHFPLGGAHSISEQTSTDQGQLLTTPAGNVVFTGLPRPRQPREPVSSGGLTLPPTAATPVSRADTTSAASTVYVVRHEAVADAPQPVRQRRDVTRNTAQRHATDLEGDPEKESADVAEDVVVHASRSHEHGRWHAMPNPFKRKRVSPPQEIQQARAAESNGIRALTPSRSVSRWGFKNRPDRIAEDDGEHSHDGVARRRQEPHLPVTIIPAQTRASGRALSVVDAADTPLPDGHAPTSSDNAGTDPIDTVDAVSYGAPAPRSITNRSPPARRPGNLSPASHRGGPSVAFQVPPRADDISPVTGRSDQPIVIPAPLRRSPLDSGKSGLDGDGTGSTF